MLTFVKMSIHVYVYVDVIFCLEKIQISLLAFFTSQAVNTFAQEGLPGFRLYLEDMKYYSAPSRFSLNTANIEVYAVLNWFYPAVHRGAVCKYTYKIEMTF